MARRSTVLPEGAGEGLGRESWVAEEHPCSANRRAERALGSRARRAKQEMDLETRSGAVKMGMAGQVLRGDWHCAEEAGLFEEEQERLCVELVPCGRVNRVLDGSEGLAPEQGQLCWVQKVEEQLCSEEGEQPKGEQVCSVGAAQQGEQPDSVAAAQTVWLHLASE